MRLIFVRHGEPDYANDCLTPQGHKEAAEAAVRLRNEGIGHIFSSPMGRARQTAQYTSDELGIPDIKILDFMHELEWGSSDGSFIPGGGSPWVITDEMTADGIRLNSPDWAETGYFAHNKVVDNISLVERELDRWLLTLGYRREGLYYRCIGSEYTDSTVALFCHGGSSTAAIGHILDISFPLLCAALHLPFTGCVILRFDNHPNSLTLPVLEAIK